MKGKVVLIPFPFDDLSATKVRPAVCLTNAVGEFQHTILAFITSRIPNTPLPTDIVFEPSHPDFAASGLRKSSVLRLHFLMTARTSLILRELGQLSETTQNEIAARLCRLLTEG
ncbi:MAG: type II toxin-antitoxin system PemK/MazF family toxin [Leptolyngbya sp. SIO1D8]|nr:type II toxin-antitoxin system PemK/MazF family toxin [Leptolyngbya sp. SIO1D8]